MSLVGCWQLCSLVDFEHCQADHQCFVVCYLQRLHFNSPTRLPLPPFLQAFIWIQLTQLEGFPITLFPSLVSFFLLGRLHFLLALLTFVLLKGVHSILKRGLVALLYLHLSSLHPILPLVFGLIILLLPDFISHTNQPQIAE